jgi:hypothetical protein
MTFEIPEGKWKQFFDDLSKRRFGWDVKIEVLDESIGDQILSAGLPLNGITIEVKSGKQMIEISVGKTAQRHLTHTILNPIKTMYLGENRYLGGVIAIEDEEGVKTLISLINPMPVYIDYFSREEVSGSQN